MLDRVRAIQEAEDPEERLRQQEERKAKIVEDIKAEEEAWKALSEPAEKKNAQNA